MTEQELLPLVGKIVCVSLLEAGEPRFVTFRPAEFYQQDGHILFAAKGGQLVDGQMRRLGFYPEHIVSAHEVGAEVPPEAHCRKFGWHSDQGWRYHDWL